MTEYLDLHGLTTYDTNIKKFIYPEVDTIAELKTVPKFSLTASARVYCKEDKCFYRPLLDEDGEVVVNKNNYLMLEKIADYSDDIKELNDKVDALANSMGSTTGDSGDIALIPFDNEAPITYTRRNLLLHDVDTTDPGSSVKTVGYKDNLAAGYVLTGESDVIRNRMFNRLRVMIKEPGWVRIGIVRGTSVYDLNGDGARRGIFAQNIRYDRTDIYPASLVGGKADTTADGTPHTALKRWLVVAWVATTGVHEWDIEDTVITSPLEYLFIECRGGSCGVISNKTGDVIVVNGVSVPNGTENNGNAWPAAGQYVTPTNFRSGFYPVAQTMLASSALFSYNNSIKTSTMYSGWADVNYDQVNDSGGKKSHLGNLNIGVYRRGDSGNGYINPIHELSTMPWGYNATSSHIVGYGPRWEVQQKIVGQEIFAIELIIYQPGDLSLFVFSSNDPATCKLLKHYTLRVRGVGRQYIHLPETVVLHEGNWIGLGGVTQAVTYYKPTAAAAFKSTDVFNPGYYDTALPSHSQGSDLEITDWTCFGDDEDALKTVVPFSNITQSREAGFNYWKGVRYIPGSKFGQGKIDFTKAEFMEATGDVNLNFEIITRKVRLSKLEDMWCSITGDSISTYAGVVSNYTNDYKLDTSIAYSETDPTEITAINAVTPANNYYRYNEVGNNAIFYPANSGTLALGIASTWWGCLIKQARMNFLRNDAWSGSKVTGTDSNTGSTAAASNIRTTLLKNNYLLPFYPIQTAGALGHMYGNPSVVFTCIGTNDLSGNVAIGSWSNTSPSNITSIIAAFERMIDRHKQYYPKTKLVYFILPRGSARFPYVNSNGVSISQLAQSLEYVAKNMGVYFVPLERFSALSNGSTLPYVWCATTGSKVTADDQWAFTADYLHPNCVGAQIIANALQRFCEESF